MFGGSLGSFTTAEDWQNAVKLLKRSDRLPIDLTGCAVTFRLRRTSDSSDALTGTTETGEITFPALGYLRWRFPEARVSSLCAGTYRASVRLSRASVTVQLFLGTVTVKEGF
jgi:hypothetical protein